jgi:hypothetical protein
MQEESSWTYRTLWKITGLVMRFVQVAKRPLSDKYYMMTMIRRAAAKLSKDEDLWDKEFKPSPVEMAQLRALVEEACLRNTYG